jgi:hypothetical protein
MAGGIATRGYVRSAPVGATFHVAPRPVAPLSAAHVQQAPLNAGAKNVINVATPQSSAPSGTTASAPKTVTAIKTSQPALPTVPKSTAGCSAFHAQLVQMAPYYSPGSFNYTQYQQTVAQYNSLCGG